MAEYILNVDGKYQHFCGLAPKDGIEVKNWTGCAGDPVEWYDPKGNKYSEKELISKRIIEDFRGEYYDINGNIRVISSIFSKPEDGWRKDKPEVYEKYVNAVWKVVPELKGIYDRMESYNSILNQIDLNKEILSSTDWYITRHLETGDEIPEEVKAQRADARVKISELREDSLYKNYDSETEQELWNSESIKYNN